MMYTEQELTAVQKQQKKRWMAVIIPCALMLSAIIVLLVIRASRTLSDTTAQIIVDALTILIGILLIGGWGMFIMPLRRYEKHINDLLHGRTHEYNDGTFNHMDEDVSVVDGVAFYALYVDALDEKNKPYERLFYYDAEKPRPDLKQGDRVHIVYHDKRIGLIETLA